MQTLPLKPILTSRVRDAVVLGLIIMTTVGQAPPIPTQRILDPPIAELGQTVASQNVFNYPLVNKVVALAIAEALLRQRWEEETALKQLPLEIIDGETFWRVLGRGHLEAEGQFCVLIRKTDGKIKDIGVFRGPGGVP